MGPGSLFSHSFFSLVGELELLKVQGVSVCSNEAAILPL